MNITGFFSIKKFKKTLSFFNSFDVIFQRGKIRREFPKEGNSAFTLIEIVIVISIMALFTVIIYSSFDKSKAKSRDQKRISDISAIQLALEQYFNRNGVYPLTLDELILANPKYISEIPTDPTTKQQYDKESTNRSGYFPIKKSNGLDNCVSYQLWTTFEQVNSYVNQKKAFNSSNLSKYPNYYECGNLHKTVDAGVAGSLVYDVMPN